MRRGESRSRCGAGARPGAYVFIINPLTGRGMDSLFTTHPATENRIAELEALERELAAAGAPPNVLLSIPGAVRGRWVTSRAAVAPVNPWGPLAIQETASPGPGR